MAFGMHAPQRVTAILVRRLTDPAQGFDKVGRRFGFAGFGRLDGR
jgi:hypothetical protein